MSGSISLSNITESSITANVSVTNPTGTQNWTATVYNWTYGFSIGTFSIPAGTTRNRSYESPGLPSGTNFEFRIYATRSDGTAISSTNWPSVGYYSASATTLGSPSPPPPPPPPATPAPSFTDATVANGLLGVSYSDGVSANNTSSYAIASGSLPPGLDLTTSTGAITGTPTQQGSFTFAITATGGGGSTSSGNLTIQIFPPGNRRNDAGFDVNLANAKRYDGAAWVNLSTMKRFDGTNWINISN
jgi:hypothetical protein